MKKVVITGANGFIGSRLTGFMANNGVRVIALDIAENNLPRDDRISFYKTDLRDRASVAELPVEPADALFHLAWLGVGAADRDDYGLQTLNIQCCLNVLELARRTSCGKAVFLGSASEYAAGSGVISGDNPFTPSDAYGAVKAACHILCDTCAKRRQLPLIWAVPSSVYGPGRDDGGILSYAIKTLLACEKPSFTRLEQQWDFLYIDDFLNALYLIGQKGVPGMAYAVGSGDTRRLSEYMLTLRDAIDPALPLGIGDLPYKTGVPDNAVFDISRLRQDTGFVPKISFREGIRDTIGFFKKTT